MARKGGHWTALLLIAVVLLAVASFGFSITNPFGHGYEVYMDMPQLIFIPPPTTTWTWANPNTATTSSAAAVATTRNLVHVANAWQQVTVHFTDGSTQVFANKNPSLITLQALPSNPDATVTKKPAWLDVESTVELQYKLRSGTENTCDPLGLTQYTEYLIVDPHMTVTADTQNTNGEVTRDVRSVDQDMFGSIKFTANDAVGVTRSWHSRIVFEGNPGSVSYPTINYAGYLNDKANAVINVVWSETFFQLVKYNFAAAVGLRSCLCGGSYDSEWNTGLGLTECNHLASHKSSDYPYSIGFLWTPGMFVSGATYTRPTVGVTTCTGGYPCVVYTQTRNRTILIPYANGTATVTEFAPPTVRTVTVGVPVNGTMTNTTGGGQPSDYCGKSDMLSKISCWLYGSTCLYNTPLGCGFSVANYWFLIIALGVIVLIILTRRW